VPSDTTILYYTSNAEPPVFEERILAYLLAQIGDTPLVTVSQKPMAQGQNICVGDVGMSNLNIFRQMQIGAQAIHTRFVCLAESDYLQPPEYFAFAPPRDDTFYYVMPLWVAFCQRGKKRLYCKKKRGSEGAMHVGRDFLLHSLETMLAGQPQWAHARGRGMEIPLPYMFKLGPAIPFVVPAPVITFKTDAQLHRRTPHELESRTSDLPYWGNIHDLEQRMGL